MKYLNGHQVELHKFTERHINANYTSWLNDSEVNRFLMTGRLLVNKDEMVVPKDDKNLMFAVMYRESSAFKYIGTASLHNIDWICRKGEVGYMIGDKQCWGQGLATEIVELITDYAFNRLNLNKTYAGVVVQNTGSAEVLRKNGYKQYATVPQDYYLEGSYLNTELFYKLQEWHRAEE